jgi:hypothetical protein
MARYFEEFDILHTRVRKGSVALEVTRHLHHHLYLSSPPLPSLISRLNVRYNVAFRALFLKTIKPSNWVEHFLAWNVTVNTDLFNGLET